MVAKYTYSMTTGTLKEFLVLNLMFGQFLQQVVNPSGKVSSVLANGQWQWRSP